MKVKDAIAQLSQLDPEQEHIFGWWDAEMLGLTEEQMTKHADQVERRMDWSNTNEDIQEHFRQAELDNPTS